MVVVMLVTVIVSVLSLGLFISIWCESTPTKTIWGTVLACLTAIGYLIQAGMGVAILGSTTLTWIIVGVWVVYVIIIYSEHLAQIY